VAFLIPALDSLPTPEARLDFLNQQLRVIAVSAAQAKARGDQADLDSLLVLYNKARADALTLRGEANETDQPAAFLLALDKFSAASVQVGVQAFGIVKAVGVGTWLLVAGAVAVLGIGFYRGSFKLRL
jgi:hypothetical protein